MDMYLAVKCEIEKDSKNYFDFLNNKAQMFFVHQQNLKNIEKDIIIKKLELQLIDKEIELQKLRNVYKYGINYENDEKDAYKLISVGKY